LRRKERDRGERGVHHLLDINARVDVFVVVE